MKFELTNFCEIDKHTAESYCRIHQESIDKNLGDIMAISANDIKDCNVVVGGSPCFTKDVLILTEEGYKKLEDIKVGDMVLSHEGKYHKVTNILNQGEKQIFKIHSAFFTDIETTDNHRFFASIEGGIPRWVEAKDLKRSDYLGCYIGDDEHNIAANDGELFVYGLYLRFGHSFTKSSITIKVPVEHMKYMNKTLHKYKVSSSLGLNNIDPKHAYFTIYFGKYDFDECLMKLSAEQCGVVWSGFAELLDDKCRQITTTDLSTAYDMAYLYMKCHKKACVIKKVKDGYMLDWGAKISNWYVENNYIWLPFNVEKTHIKKPVFDLTVDAAHSFVVHHCSVHNCSQKGSGFDAI